MLRLARLALTSLGLLVAVGAAPAVAATRYASPAGSGDAAQCAESAPCSIQDAVKPDYTDDGDEVILKPGTYTSEVELAVIGDVDVHGQGAPAETRIVSRLSTPGNNSGVFLGDGAKLRNVEVDHSSDQAL